MDVDESEVDANNARNLPQNEEDKKEESPPFASNKILRMMKSMGYQSGLGLGKNQQGIVEPIKVKGQTQQRGLGLKIESLEHSKEEWDFLSDPAITEEVLEWFNCSTLSPVDITEIITCQEGHPLTDIEKEHNFCTKETLHDVIIAKNIFDKLNLKELCNARTRANPFETIRSVFFMNRASLKMANIDAATGFMFTNIPENPLHLDNTGPFYFADVCAGPGGFTEYVLWRKKWLFKGFGFTLRGEHDFKLTDSVCISPVTFHPFYGVKQDGNVCCPENIDDFKKKVLFETQNRGVHFMMSDGGFSVEGNENLQEILSKNIYICQCFVALEILRKHGHFVTKVFDLFTCFSVGLLYLMCKCFEKVCILKPNSSRPANSERYLICCNYKGRDEVQNIRSYIRRIIHRLWKLKDNLDLDVIEIVPLQILKNDDHFYSYIFNSNNRIAKHQTMSLQKLAAFCRNPALVDPRQDELRRNCLNYWKIPDEAKVPRARYVIEDLLSEIDIKDDVLRTEPKQINSLETEFAQDIQDWGYIPLQCRRNETNYSTCNFYAGVEFSMTYRLRQEKWSRVKKLQLPRGTLLYGEVARETLKDSTDHIIYKYSLHVIDALRLGDLSLVNSSFDERTKLIRIFCAAVNHEFATNMRIRQKIVNSLSSISVNSCLIKDESTENIIAKLPVLGFNISEEFFEVNSVLLLKRSNGELFNSTYRILFLNEKKNDDNVDLALDSLINFVKHKTALHTT